MQITFRSQYDAKVSESSIDSHQDFHHAIVKDGNTKHAVYPRYDGELTCSCAGTNGGCKHTRAVEDRLGRNDDPEKMARLMKIAQATE